MTILLFIAGFCFGVGFLGYILKDTENKGYVKGYQDGWKDAESEGIREAHKYQ